MRILLTCIFAACAAALRARGRQPAVFSLLSITLFPLGRAARVKVSDAFHLPPGCHCGREGIDCHPVGAQCRLQHLSVGRDDSARQTGPGHDLGAPNAASTPVGARIARPHACTRPERRLHGNGERKPCIDSSPAFRVRHKTELPRRYRKSNFSTACGQICLRSRAPVNIPRRG